MAEVREITSTLAELYKFYTQRQASYLRLNSKLTGIAVTDQWQKIQVNDIAFTLHNLGGFTFDEVNHRFYWDLDGSYGVSLPATFVGSAGLEVTAGISGTETVSMGLFIDDELIIETPMTFTALDAITAYSGNDILVDSNGDDLLQSGSYYEFWIKAGVGQTLTVTADYLNTTFKRD